jgi:GNAT superfamily N-acetyltransferase
MSVTYAQEQSLSVEDYVGVLGDCAMRDQRPLDNIARIAAMLAGANFIVTAREDGHILGLARCMTDNAWTCYCLELAVRDSAQKRGVGRGILETCWALLGPRLSFVLMSDPRAVGFYRQVGMEQYAETYFHARLDHT